MRALAPPAIVRLARSLRPEWRYAGTDGSAIDPREWQHPTVTSAQLRKWPRWVELIHSGEPVAHAFEAPVLGSAGVQAHNIALTFGYVLAIAAQHARADTLRVLDWGGGLGHYYPLTRRLLNGVELSYTVVDLPDLIAAGRTVNPQAVFITPQEVPQSGRYDLVFASGSIQYVPDWHGLLADLARVTDGHLYLARIPVVRHVASFVAVQRAHRYGYKTRYRGWCLNQNELLGAAQAAGARLINEFLLEEYPPLAGAPEQPVGVGYLFLHSATQ